MNESTIFNAAVKLPSGERAGFLAAACAENAKLQADVERLLHEHEDKSGGFLDGPTLSSGSDASRPIAELPGSLIGPYCDASSLQPRRQAAG